MQEDTESELRAHFFSGKSIGRSLKEVAVDLVETDTEALVSRWYKGTSSTDLYTWADRKNNIIKQQLTFNGQVVEWNCIEGIKTGVLVEQSIGNTEQSKRASTGSGEAEARLSETIQFDHDPQKTCVDLALEILNHTQFEGRVREELIGNFKDPKHIENMPTKLFLDRFGLSIPFARSGGMRWWHVLAKRVASFFNR